MLEKQQLSISHSEHLENNRKIPCELAAEMGVVSRGPNMAFEFRRNGVCVYRQVKGESRDEQGNRIKEFHIEPKGSVLFFWNDDCLNEPLPPDATLIITEGVEDALSWMVAGATHVVSVPNGTSDRPGEGDVDPSEDHRFAYLWVNGRLDPRVDRYKRFILSSDGDKAGAVLRDELALRLGRDRRWWVAYPEGCKDSNEVLVKHGIDGIAAMLVGAKPIVPSELVQYDDIPDIDCPTYSTGWPQVDPFMRLTTPELVIVTGAPGSGKSQFALALGANLAWHHKMPGAILQFEDDVRRNRSDLVRFAQAKLGFDFHDAEGKRSARAWMNRMFRTIAPRERADVSEDADQSLAWLRRIMVEAATRHGAKWVLIDPWNEVEHMFSRGETEAIYLNRAVRDLKQLARRLQIILMIVVHPHVAGGQKHVAEASLYDINGGAVWKNKADHGVICWRETPTAATTILKVDKSKNHSFLGRPGMFKMTFRPTSADYEWGGAYSGGT